MNICQEFHQAIAFEGQFGGCPLCEMIRERDAALAEHEVSIEILSARIEELLDERDALRTELKI